MNPWKIKWAFSFFWMVGEQKPVSLALVSRPFGGSGAGGRTGAEKIDNCGD